MGEKSALKIKDSKFFKGTNLLGKALMEVRELLKQNK
jgi:predicted NAD-dependent protein-ADP-ribosyltransferase YbiA (DUF1768 family)